MALTAEERKYNVLTWVNKVRQELGIKYPLKKLPKGWRFSADSCPLALALHAKSVAGDADFEFADPIVLPKYVRKFVSDFDNKRYPELVRSK